MPVLTKTRAQLVTRAARKARLIAAGQSLETEDSTVIDDAIDGMLADLAARSVVYVADDTAIDIAVFESLADVLAEVIAPDYGKPRDMNAVTAAEMRLRTATSTAPTYEPLKATYY